MARQRAAGDAPPPRRRRDQQAPAAANNGANGAVPLRAPPPRRSASRTPPATPSPLSTRRYKRRKEQQTPREQLQKIFDNSRLAMDTRVLDLRMQQAATELQLMDGLLLPNPAANIDRRARDLANGCIRLGDARRDLTNEARTHASRLTVYPVESDYVNRANLIKTRLEHVKDRERRALDTLLNMDDVYFKQRIATNQRASLLAEFTCWSEDAQSLIDYSASFCYSNSPTCDFDHLDKVVCPRVQNCMDAEEGLLQKWEQIGQRRDDRRLTPFPLGRLIPVRNRFIDKRMLLERVKVHWPSIQLHCSDIDTRFTDYRGIYEQFLDAYAQQLDLQTLYDEAVVEYDTMKNTEQALQVVLNGVQGWSHYATREAARMIRDVERKHTILTSTSTLFNRKSDELRDEVVIIEGGANTQERQLAGLVGQLNRDQLTADQLRQLKERFDDQAIESRQSIADCVMTVVHVIKSCSFPANRRVTIRESVAKLKKIQLSSLQWSYVLQLEVKMVGSIQPLCQTVMQEGRRVMIGSRKFSYLFGTMLNFKSYNEFCTNNRLYTDVDGVTPLNFLKTHRILLKSPENTEIPMESIFDMVYRQQMGSTKQQLDQMLTTEFVLVGNIDRVRLERVLGRGPVLDHLLERIDPNMHVFPVSELVKQFFCR